MTTRPASGLVMGVFAAAVVVSIVHYVDNVANYEEYPVPGPGGPPAPSAPLIALSWFVFTAAGLAGVLAYRRHRDRAAAVLLALYSGSGIIGIGHYLVSGATSMVWWRQAHVVADIMLGFAVLVIALRLALARGVD